jgi:hypothetical protein
MFEGKLHVLPPHAHENDLIACNLLKAIDRYEQFALLYPLDNDMLHRVFNAALLQEDYEICQLISELMEERKMLKGTATVNG